MGLQQRIHRALEGDEGKGLTVTQVGLFLTIIVAVVIAVLGTEPELPATARMWMQRAEVLVGFVFLAEYILRVWSIGANPRYAGFAGRLRYIATPMLVIDLLAMLPFLLGAIGAESMVLRSFRVLRLLALTKIVRYSTAMRLVMVSIAERRYELGFAVLLAGLMILFTSSALYIIEGSNNPEAFGSIPRAMWWAVVTLTTVGYGDVVPHTPLGKMFAAFTAIAGIGMIAMPTGILAAAFSDGFTRARKHRHPHDPDSEHNPPS